MMQIYINLKNYNKDQQKYDRDYFVQLVTRCESLGIDIKWSRQHLKTGNEKFAIITIPEGKSEITPLHQIKMWTSEMLMPGCSFRSHHPTKRYITLKTMIENFDALVLQQDKKLPEELYSMEHELYGIVLH
jgi:hypothetical protein